MTRKIFAIDPGTIQSGWVALQDGMIEDFGLEPNGLLRQRLRQIPDDYSFVIEMIACYGMATGQTTFETATWIGRFIEAYGTKDYRLIYRREVKSYICGSARAKDTNIRRALLDRFGEPGTKKKPGPTYGIKKDIWQALAVAVTCDEQIKSGEVGRRLLADDPAAREALEEKRARKREKRARAKNGGCDVASSD